MGLPTTRRRVQSTTYRVKFMFWFDYPLHTGDLRCKFSPTDGYLRRDYGTKESR
jgi:hypothetical protein